MVNILGSALILCGGGLLWWRSLTEARWRREVLSAMIVALRRMQEEIRITRTPLPVLMERLSMDGQEDVAALFAAVTAAIRDDGLLPEIWKREIEKMPLQRRERELLLRMELWGDEEHICKELALAVCGLRKSAEEAESRRAETEKRMAVLCFSGAAMLVILLI